MNRIWKALLSTAMVAMVSMTGSQLFAGDKVVIDGSTTVEPIARAFAGYYMARNKDAKVTVSGTGSGNGAKSLINGRCDIGCMSRFMKDKEMKAAVEKGVTPVFHVVGMDGIAVAVHKSNPVSGLTMKQLHDIYAGSIKNWKEVGGPNKKITVISRDTTSGTYEVFHDLVLKGDRMHGAEYVGSNAAARARVIDTPGAIAYIGLGFVSGVKAISINGVTPTLKTVGGGEYPIARPLYMVTNGYPELGSAVQAIVTMYLKPFGQEMVKGIGYVPVTQY